MYQMALDNELIVDNFAGGGGASCGIEMALHRPVNIAINHDEDAIGMHEANHPMTRHYCESVWDVNPREVCAGRPVGLAWFSPDCKHFSKAKGGKPVDKAIRGLAWVAVRWAATVKPRIIILENVEEFVTWGPLRPVRDEDGTHVTDKNGKELFEPCPLRRGMTFKAFVQALEKHGYKVEWRELKACDYGAPTIRKRLFMIARCDGLPIVWPEKTHGPGLLPYRTAAECIDWSIPCPSIFDRKRPLVENTMRRIAKGLKKFVFDAAEPFMIYVAHSDSGPNSKRWGRGDRSLLDPMPTITASGGDTALITPLVTPYPAGVGGRAGQSRPRGGDEPLATITTKGDTALVAPYIVGAGGPARAGEPCGVEKPFQTITTKNNRHLVNAFIVKHFGGYYDGAGSDMRDPYPTVLASGRQNQLCTSHIMKMRGSADREKHGQPMDEPLHTVSAGGLHHAEVRAFLIKYFGTDQDPRLEEPLHTITTKHRFGLVKITGELWQIIDIGMRMLVPRELYRAQSFPDSYEITKTAKGKKLTQSAQVKMCGNSVPPVMAEAIVKANYWQSELLREAVA